MLIPLLCIAAFAVLIEAQYMEGTLPPSAAPPDDIQVQGTDAPRAVPRDDSERQGTDTPSVAVLICANKW